MFGNSSKRTSKKTLVSAKRSLVVSLNGTSAIMLGIASFPPIVSQTYLQSGFYLTALARAYLSSAQSAAVVPPIATLSTVKP